MQHIFGREKRISEKNGEIDVHYLFGKMSLFVDGFDQSTDYVAELWHLALRHLPPSFSAKRILMLGLGGGCALQELRKRFPGCDITVVEWDPMMIELYQEMHQKDEPITIITGDASVIVPAMHEQFDVVLVDLFKGNITPKELRNKEMIGSIARTVSANGYCILNAFVSLDLPPLFAQHFTQKDTWKYRYNTLVLYCSKPL